MNNTELEELSGIWEKVGEQVDRQLHVNKKIIHKMTQQQYRSQLNKIAYPEAVGCVICLIMAGVILWNFQELDTVGLRVCGVVSEGLLVVLPTLSLVGLKGFGRIGIDAAPYAETVRAFAVQKRRWWRLHQWNVGLSSPFLIAYFPVATRLLAEKDITQRWSFWLVIVPVCLVVQLMVSLWVVRCYRRVLQQAGDLLGELT